MNKDRDRQPEPHTIEQVASIAKDNTLRDGYHVPMVLADGSINQAAIQIAEPGKTSEERQYQMFQAGFLLSQENSIGLLQQVFFVSEGWMSAGTTEQAPITPPSQDPNRKEILLVASLNVLTGQNE